MARKRCSDEDILKLPREIELKLAEGSDVHTACHAVGVSDASYYNWRRRFGGMARAQMSELRGLDALRVGAKVSAMHAGFITNTAGGPAESLYDDETGEDVSLEPGTARRLGLGEDIKSSAHNHAQETNGFVSSQLRALATGMGVLELLVSGDLS